MPGQTVSRLFRVYTVCHSACIVWTHYTIVEPHSSNFRVITTNCLGWVVGLGDGAGYLLVPGLYGLYFFLYIYTFHLSSISNVLPFWRRLKMTEIL